MSVCAAAGDDDALIRNTHTLAIVHTQMETILSGAVHD